jgi:hypothetical protein
MMMKELEESNRFKMVEERKTQGFLESICREGRRMMIFGSGGLSSYFAIEFHSKSSSYQFKITTKQENNYIY